MRASLDGLSVGDAFGERFFFPAVVDAYLADRVAPPGPWPWTDDTNMALSIGELLTDSGAVDQDLLAESFGLRFDGARGYGQAMYGLLAKYALGIGWEQEAPRLFGGQGSYGNGAAMRVAPLGAFFVGDLDRAAIEAEKSAEVTHAHPEAVAGAIAVAVAAAIAGTSRGDEPHSSQDLIEAVIDRTPSSEVRDRLERTRRIRSDSSLSYIVTLLGNGSRITAQDTVAFAIWAAAQHLNDYETGLWLTASAHGDVDTNCAIVGGIIASRVGIEGIPDQWLHRREPLPEWHVTR
jgi:ADP-ribosylglycohydrolase